MSRGVCAALAFSICLLTLGDNALAQVSGSATVVSDFRFRGVSLSDDKPAAQLSLAYDHSSGAYVGAFASTVRFAHALPPGALLVSYAGYAQRLSSRSSWDVGAQYVSFTRTPDLNYPELYIGGAFETLSARLHYTRHYFGVEYDSFYAEVNGAQPLFGPIQLLAHLGVLRTRENAVSTAYEFPTFVPANTLRWDGRISIAAALQPIGVQLSWVARSASAVSYIPTSTRRRAALVLSVSLPF